MSEKTADRALAMMRPASSTAEAGRALTPQERAERELAQIDEQMDALMNKPEQHQALQNPPGQALQPPDGRTTTPGVSAPVAAGAFNQMVLNCVVPGAGSLLAGRYGLGAMQLGMAVLSVPMLLSGHWFLAIGMAIFAYVWSVISGIGFLSKSGTRSWK